MSNHHTFLATFHASIFFSIKYLQAKAHWSLSPLLLAVVTHLLSLPEATPSRGADLHRGQPALSHRLVFVTRLRCETLLILYNDAPHPSPASWCYTGVWWHLSTAGWWCSPRSHSHISGYIFCRSLILSSPGLSIDFSDLLSYRKTLGDIVTHLKFQTC